MAYLDHNASAPLLEGVAEQMMRWMRAGVANPDSLHRPGIASRQIIDEARAQVARFVGAKPSEVIFTSGATEANQTIVTHLAHGGGRLVALSTEHPAVLAPLAALANPVSYVAVDHQGRVDLESLAQLLPGSAGLFLMAANNETGVIHDLDAVAQLVTRAAVPWHTDAVQLARWAPINLREGYGRALTSLAMSAHKLGGPQGIGALVVRGGTITPLIRGGAQQGARRGGTPPVVAIGGFGVALAGGRPERARVAQLRDRLESEIITACPGSVVYGRKAERLPNTSYVAIRHQGAWADGEWLTLGLAEQGVAVSTGAACASGESRPSHVLDAMGVDAAEAQASIRFSLGPTSTEADIMRCVVALQAVLRAG